MTMKVRNDTYNLRDRSPAYEQIQYPSEAAYLQPAQEDDEQPPQPELLDEPDEALLDDLPIPKRDRSFSVFSEPHFPQATAGFDPKTSFSNSALQSLQRYS